MLINIDAGPISPAFFLFHRFDLNPTIHYFLETIEFKPLLNAIVKFNKKKNKLKKK